MKLSLLENEVKKAVDNGEFEYFASEYMNGSSEIDPILKNCRLSGIWLAVHNNIGKIRYSALKTAYGNRKSFQLHGLESLTSKEANPINQKITHLTKPFYEAYNVLSDYKNQEFKEAKV
ncbi:hypothetical protein CMO90_03665 [Candidatus Woesearchaeota archaeon]|jgi:hypothetical protein|nr:hypothetical protein [Candidatus Woesearchaeota archaeon]|tara:strand:+ start:32 stop:388 length:357 start_codon:yes stop_codon:yes gene_type:complete